MGGAVDGLLQQLFCSLRRLGSVGVPSGYDPPVSCRGAFPHWMAWTFLPNQVFHIVRRDPEGEIPRFINLAEN